MVPAASLKLKRGAALGRRLLMAGLLAVGGGQLGHAIYMSAKAQLAQILMERAWEQGADGTPGKPWPWADTRPLVKLDFLRLHKHLIVLEGASGRNLAFGPTHMSGSVDPGERGVSVIAGHRDTSFEFLQEVRRGERFSVEYPDGRRLTFQVTEIRIADIRNSQLRLDADQPVIALVSCFPFHTLQAGGPLRYVVIAQGAPRRHSA